MATIGKVNHADILMGSDGRSRGCGVVEYAFSADVALAIQKLTDSELDGRKIFVREDREEKAQQQPQQHPGPKPVAEGVSLYVGNLAYSMTWGELKDLFADYGVIRADIPSQAGKSRGFGIVVVDSQEHAEAAIAGLNGTEHLSRQLMVRLDREA